MSFIKNLFEKRKDKKYGKGHKLGDGSTPSTSSQYQPEQHAAYRPPSSANQSEASRMAGEAALARMTNKNAPKPTSSYKSQVSKEADRMNQTDAEMKKALAMKEHYFGQRTQLNEAAPVALKNPILFNSVLTGPGVRLPKEDLEDLIEQTLLTQLEDEPILVAVTLLFTANHKNQEKLTKCVEILNKFVANILNSPQEEKYRKIRVENAIFKEKVYSVKYADLVLKKSGFKATTLKLTEVDEDYFLYEGDNMDKLESLKEALALGEPIVPTLDRDLKVYRVSSNSKTDCRKFDIGPEFYNVTVEDLRKEHKVKMEEIEKQGMLRTKAMRERDEQLELRRYNYCLVRVRFPSDYILQALFRSTETYETLYHFIQSQLEYDSVPFELFGHSLKKNVELSATLAEIGLAPAALINFKWNESSAQEAAQMNINLKCYVKASLMEKAVLLE